MAVDPNALTERAALLIEQAREEGRAIGRREAEARFYGEASAVLLAHLFADSAEAAANRIRPHNLDAAQMMERAAGQFRTYATPARVQSTDPTDLATGIALTAPVLVRFVTAVEPATITTTTVQVRPAAGGTALQAVVTYDPVTFTASLVPANGFSAGVEYDIVVAPEVRALGGQPMGTEFRARFTTAVALV